MIKSSSEQTDQSRRTLMTAGAAGVLAAGATAVQAQPSSAAGSVPSQNEGKGRIIGRNAGAIRQRRESQLQGKVAVVTGAARGIGRAIAVDLAANGADVVVIDICGPVSRASNAVPASRDELDETARQIQSLGRRCTPVVADIRDIAALRKIADDVERQFGRIDILVANAAIQRWKEILEMEDSDWRDVIDNNLNGTANTLRAFAPKMVARKYGRVIVVSSLQGKHGTGGAASYSASKWGIIGLMKSAAIEWGKHGVTVNAILPGLVDTALTRYPERWSHVLGETMIDPPKNPTEQETWDNRSPRVPLKVAWLQPEDISPAAVFLASDSAAMATGAEWEMTGGDSAQNV